MRQETGPWVSRLWDEKPSRYSRALLETLALIADDPDAPAGTWVHWVLYNIPASVTELPEGAAAAGAEGVNGFGKPGYGGPMPPPGHGAHHYFFVLMALDRELGLEPGLTLEGLKIIYDKNRKEDR